MAGKGDKWRNTNWSNYWEADYWKEKKDVDKCNKTSDEKKQKNKPKK